MKRIFSLLLITLTSYLYAWPIELQSALQAIWVERLNASPRKILSAPKPDDQTPVTLSQAWDAKKRLITTQTLQPITDALGQVAIEAELVFFPMQEALGKMVVSLKPTQQPLAPIQRLVIFNRATLPTCQVTLVNKHPVIQGDGWYCFAKDINVQINRYTAPDGTVTHSMVAPPPKVWRIGSPFTTSIYFGDGTIDAVNLQKILTHETSL